MEFFFFAGACNAFGPCNAQRVLGLLACMERRASVSTALSYALGIASASTLLGLGASLVQALLVSYRPLNALMALLCIALGLIGLRRADYCEHDVEADSRLSAFRVWSLGFGSTLLIAPCCTPLLLLVAAYASTPLIQADALAYGCGNAAPYLFGALLLRRSLSRVVSQAHRQALAVITSTLTLALGLLYCSEI
jgi:cytochrome c biogenesis protein CcdA